LDPAPAIGSGSSHPKLLGLAPALGSGSISTALVAVGEGVKRNYITNQVHTTFTFHSQVRTQELIFVCPIYAMTAHVKKKLS